MKKKRFRVEYTDPQTGEKKTETFGSQAATAMFVSSMRRFSPLVHDSWEADDEETK